MRMRNGAFVHQRLNLSRGSSYSVEVLGGDKYAQHTTTFLLLQASTRVENLQARQGDAIRDDKIGYKSFGTSEDTCCFPMSQSRQAPQKYIIPLYTQRDLPPKDLPHLRTTLLPSTFQTAAYPIFASRTGFYFFTLPPSIRFGNGH
jgi:hypothetical protein